MNAAYIHETNSSPTPEQCHEAIARHAYEKWVARGCPAGTAFQDWIEAEAELGAARDGTGKAGETWPRLSDAWAPSSGG